MVATRPSLRHPPSPLRSGTLSTRFDEQAYLNAGLRIVMLDERSPSARSPSAASRSSDEEEGEVEEEEEEAAGEEEEERDGDEGVAVGVESTDGVDATALASAVDGAAHSPARVAKQREFYHEGGIAEYVEHICMGKRALFDAPSSIQVSATLRDVGVDVALRWNADMCAARRAHDACPP